MLKICQNGTLFRKLCHFDLLRSNHLIAPPPLGLVKRGVGGILGLNNSGDSGNAETPSEMVIL
jgi:hypothetical protein